AIAATHPLSLHDALPISLDHAMFSLNRFLAALVMGCVMTAVMLAFMWKMYRGAATKFAVLIGAVALSGALLAMNRSQVLVGDTRSEEHTSELQSRENLVC